MLQTGHAIGYDLLSAQLQARLPAAYLRGLDETLDYRPPPLCVEIFKPIVAKLKIVNLSGCRSRLYQSCVRDELHKVVGAGIRYYSIAFAMYDQN